VDWPGISELTQHEENSVDPNVSRASDASSSMRPLMKRLFNACTPDQAGLLRMLAVAHIQNVDPAPLVDSLGRELPIGRRVLIRQLATKLSDGQSLTEAIANDQRLLPEQAIVALRLAAETDTLDAFFHGILACPAVNEGSAQFQLANRPPGYLGLYFKTMYMLCVLVFIMVYIVPQFLQMLDEFGLAPPRALFLMMWTTQLIFTLWFIPVLLFAGWMILSIRSKLRKLGRRLSPTRWAADIESRPVQSLRTLAMAAAVSNDGSDEVRLDQLASMHPNKATARSLQQAANRTEAALGPWPALAQEKMLTRVQAKALTMASSPGVRAWLLHQMADRRANQFAFWQAGRRRTIVGFVNAILTAVVLLFGVGIFSTLLAIIYSIVGQ
jgi:ABC-type multidrug transport system fused ATPase/permease subunit